MPRNKLEKSQHTEPTSTQTIQYSAQRIGIFIDVQNMYYSAKNLFGAKVNFINVVKGAIRGRQLIRAIAYVVETPQQHEVRFLDALRLQGIELKERDLQVFSSGVKKADWDVGIAVDAIRMSDVLDVIVLVSGDGDYLPLVEYLQNKGRKVEVMAFRSTASSRLVDMCDQFTDLADESQDFMIRPQAPTPHHPKHVDMLPETADEVVEEAEKEAEIAQSAIPEAVEAAPRFNGRDRNQHKRRSKRTIM